MTKRAGLFWIILITIIANGILIISQGTGTPNTLRVLTDANGYLVTAMSAQTAPYTTSTFGNTRLKTDSNGNLLTAGTVVPGNFGNQAVYTYLGNPTGSSAAPIFTNLPIYLANGVTSGNVYKARGVLYWQNPALTTTSTSAVPVSSTVFTIKGGTFGTNGDRLYIRTSVTLSAATTDNKNAHCGIGYSSYNTSTGAFTGGIDMTGTASVSNTGSVSIWGEYLVTRLGATSTSYETQTKWGSSATTQGVNYATSSAITWANDVPIICNAYNTTPGTQTLTLNEVSIEWIPYHP